MAIYILFEIHSSTRRTEIERFPTMLDAVTSCRRRFDVALIEMDNFHAADVLTKSGGLYAIERIEVE